MSQEFDFYTEILTEFCTLENNPKLTEAWKIQSIIKLMDLAKEINDGKQFIQTGLLVIMQLATGKYCDDIETYSRNLKELLKHEREYVISALKAELN